MTDDIAELLNEERGAPGLSPAARERVRARLLAAVAVPVVAGAAAGALAVKAGVGAAPTASLLSRILSRLLASKWSLSIVMLAVGASGGAAVHAAAVAGPATTRLAPGGVDLKGGADAPVQSRALRTNPTVGVRPEDLPNAPVPTAIGTANATNGTHDDPREAREEALRKERTVLEVARTALTRGDFASARVALDRHASEFPRGQFREERESMMVQTLAGLGDGAAARARARQFHQQFPNSMFGAGVDKAAPPISVTEPR
jgi:hypothetical protein